jgi:bifunctional DNA-binding transcriptional regulator/antitoxin component of YhaV-PrlF toxin-antitoxin module
MTIIVKATTKGQITLPASWRRIFDTDRYIVKTIGKKLEISPLNLSAIENAEEYTVFDAIRDNNGKGIKAKDLVKVLNKI